MTRISPVFSEITFSDNNEPQLEDESSVAAMVKIITERMFDDDAEEVEKSFDELFYMVAGNKENGKFLMKLGGPSTIIGFMRKWNKSPKIQGLGCAILHYCCQVASWEEMNTIFQLGAVDATMKAMKEFLYEYEYYVHPNACDCFLEELAEKFAEDEDFLPLLEDGTYNYELQRGDETSVGAMVRIITERMFDDDAEEVEKSFDELLDMVDMNEENSKLLIKLGGPSTILGFMRKWNKSAKIQHRSCAILGRCCQSGNEEEMKTIFQLGAVDVALKSMKQYRDDDNVQSNAIYIFAALAENEDYAKYMILDCDALKQVLHGMTKFPVDGFLQKNAGYFLKRTSAVKELKTPMIKAGALVALAQVIETFVEETSYQETIIQINARMALTQLAENQSLIKAIGKAKKAN